MSTKSFKKAVKLGKSAGPDNISAKDLKLDEKTPIKTLYKLFRKKCLYSKLSRPMETARKVQKRIAATTSYLPPVHSICSMISYYIESNNLLRKHQWGFRKHHSTEDLLLHQTECWHRTLDQGKSVAVLFIE